MQFLQIVFLKLNLMGVALEQNTHAHCKNQRIVTLLLFVSVIVNPPFAFSQTRLLSSLQWQSKARSTRG